MAPRGEATAGHVSMMNDVLISQLPPKSLRIPLRALIDADPANASIFASTIQSKLHDPSTSSNLEDIPSDTLRTCLRGLLGVSTANVNVFVAIIRAALQSQTPSDALPDLTDVLAEPGPSPEFLDLLVSARVRFAAHLVRPALVYLSVLPEGIVKLQLQLHPGPLYDKLVEAGGDMVQAAQALKESDDRSEGTKHILETLIQRLLECREYCISSSSSQQFLFTPFPFARAVTQLIDAAHILYPRDSSVKAIKIPEYTTLHHPSVCKKPIAKVKLGSLEVPRLFFGLWQLSSPAWGSASEEKIMNELIELVSNGLIAADMADHYADAELIFGQFRNHILFPTQREPLICATKYCQFVRIPADVLITSDLVMRKVKERTDRVGGTVDLLQVHWQYLDDERYFEVFEHLIAITKSHPKLIRAVGLCNFDATTTERICLHLLKVKGEVGIVSNQVQYSLVDQRPRFAMTEVCKKYGIKLLTYGTFCGGFLADRWVGMMEPDIYTGGLNTSQRKYFDMIRAWGGWELFQELLVVLKGIATSRGVDVSNVAARWVLERPETGVVIVGSRLGVTSHIPSTLRALDFSFTKQDLAEIERVIAKSRVREMFEQIGDCGSEYR